MTVLEQGVVVSASSGMSGFVEDEAVFVYCYLGFYGVSLLFAAVVRLSFALGFRPWNLLLSRIQESFESWKHGFNLVECLQPPNFLMLLFWQGQNIAYERLKLSDVF